LSTGVPEIEGVEELAGGMINAWITAVAGELTGPLEPAVFVAVTATTMVEPTSAVTSA
jgi:hypothetical protein